MNVNSRCQVLINKKSEGGREGEREGGRGEKEGERRRGKGEEKGEELLGCG